MQTRTPVWIAASLLLAAGAAIAFRQILWKVYAGPVGDYGSSPFTVGNFESTLFFWFGGLGLLASIGITIGVSLALPNGIRVPDWSTAMILVVVALAIGARFFVFQNAAVTDEENVHRFTAQLLNHGRLTLQTQVPEDLLGRRWGWFRRGEHWAGIYPYGWPMILALASLARL